MWVRTADSTPVLPLQSTHTVYTTHAHAQTSHTSTYTDTHSVHSRLLGCLALHGEVLCQTWNDVIQWSRTGGGGPQGVFGPAPCGHPLQWTQARTVVTAKAPQRLRCFLDREWKLTHIASSNFSMDGELVEPIEVSCSYHRPHF